MPRAPCNCPYLRRKHGVQAPGTATSSHLSALRCNLGSPTTRPYNKSDPSQPRHFLDLAKSCQKLPQLVGALLERQRIDKDLSSGQRVHSFGGSISHKVPALSTSTSQLRGQSGLLLSGLLVRWQSSHVRAHHGNLIEVQAEVLWRSDLAIVD